MEESDDSWRYPHAREIATLLWETRADPRACIEALFNVVLNPEMNEGYLVYLDAIDGAEKTLIQLVGEEAEWGRDLIRLYEQKRQRLTP